MDVFLERLNVWNASQQENGTGVQAELVTPMEERDWGQRVIRIYDPDHHVIEIAETMEGVARRLQADGVTAEAIAEKMRLPLDTVQGMTGKMITPLAQNALK